MQFIVSATDDAKAKTLRVTRHYASLARDAALRYAENIAIAQDLPFDDLWRAEREIMQWDGIDPVRVGLGTYVIEIEE